MKTSSLLPLVLSTVACASASAQSPQPAPCSDPAYRQFDFWIGEWDVTKPDGTLAGTNRITKEYGDCVLRERYETPRGYRGESFNTYDAGRGVWHQTWVDNTGVVLVIEGGFTGSAMVLEGATQDAQGTQTKQRITWTPNDDGTVRQLWESTDADGNWTVAFDGLYRRRGTQP